MTPLLALALLASPSDNLERFDVKAKLVEIPKAFPDDDLYEYAFVMKYEVLEGELAGKTLLVAHFAPKRRRNKIEGDLEKYVSGSLRRFREGDTHKMTLTKHIEKIFEGGNLEDEYEDLDRKSPRYWCLKVDKAD